MTQLLDRDADALARLWLAKFEPADVARPASDAIVAAAAARGERLTAWMALAFEALKEANLHNVMNLPSQPVRIRHLLGLVRAGGWQRAIELAEAADAMTCLVVLEPQPAAVNMLLAHTADRPAAEYGWTAQTLSVLYTAAGAFDAGLEYGFRACEAARQAGIDVLTAAAYNALGYAFLSVGDVEGAMAVLPEAIAAKRRFGSPAWGAIYNFMLAQTLGGHWDAARESLAEFRQLLVTDHRATANLRCLAACVMARTGRRDEALQLVQALPAAQEDTPAAAANRAWLIADVHLANDHPEAARAAVDNFLAQQRTKEHALAMSPMNGTQIYRVLSAAHEALGDHRLALESLRRSQAYCFSWVGQSMRMRLQALHREAEPGVQRGSVTVHHQERLGAIERAVDVARAGSVSAKEPDNAGQLGRFLAHVTHEMSSPINGLIGMTSLMMLSNLDERQRRYMTLAQSSAQALLRLCNDVLDLAKLEAGQFSLNLQPADVGALLRELAEFFDVGLLRSGVRLQTQVASNLPPRLICDDLRLRQIVTNLLSNAAKFTTDGHIDLTANWVTSGPDDGVLQVAVTDTGPGFDEATRARLFREFVQASAAVSARHGGTGLGLALCRNLLVRMGGRIDVESRPGQGSRFWFELPLQVAEPARPHPTPDGAARRL